MDLRGYLKLLGMYVLLVVVQVLVFNNIKISSYGITPMFYVLFVLSVPFEVPNWLQLFFAFVLGYSVDMFADTPGLNTAASVFMAFMRPVMLNLLAPRDGYESGLFPYATYMGMPWYIRYCVPLILAHHLSFFLIDSIGFFSLSQILIKVLATTSVTILFVILAQFFVHK
ncbi:MAG: hypothetical protein J6T70_19170 [Bacteroidales bacterium]|nr:hypothetical protein [Bacteroidales bacterium]